MEQREESLPQLAGVEGPAELAEALLAESPHDSVGGVQIVHDLLQVGWLQEQLVVDNTDKLVEQPTEMKSTQPRVMTTPLSIHPRPLSRTPHTH